MPEGESFLQYMLLAKYRLYNSAFAVRKPLPHTSAIGSATQSSQNSGRATINDKRMHRWSMVICHLDAANLRPMRSWSRSERVKYPSAEPPCRAPKWQLTNG